MHDPTIRYRGRFAPSPTGPLHFGSLIAAVGSYLEARRNAGEWLVRMENLDPPREEPGAADAILRILEAYGFEWDGPVLRQSERTGAYAAALAQLQRGGFVFPCACSRREVSDSLLGTTAEPVYPGTCRSGIAPGRAARAMRMRVDDAVISFDDRIQGAFEQDLAREVGDFVVKRSDGLFAYQLAVVVDDFDQGITDVVRGADLLASTPRQMLLQERLGYPSLRYAHLPVAVNPDGEKLSKQTRAAPLEASQAPLQLWLALRFLGQDPPSALSSEDLATLWSWARSNWRLERVPRKRILSEARADL
jgi:glutamyl-Q tRNA(Asp) synthetase